MCKALYPHDRFPMSIYMDVAAGAIKKGNADTGAKISFRAGLDGLKINKFDKMNFKKQTKYLKSIENTPFFGLVRGHTVVALYDHKEVHKIFGYHGIQRFCELLCDHKVLLPYDLLLSQRTECSLLILGI